MVALGLTYVEIGHRTGYSASYVSNLHKNSPAFKELVALYAGEVQLELEGVVQRRMQVGMMALDELAARLSDQGEAAKMSVRELTEIHDSMLTRPVAAEKSSGPGGAVQGQAAPVLIQFVSGGPGSVTIEGQTQIEGLGQ